MSEETKNDFKETVCLLSEMDTAGLRIVKTCAEALRAYQEAQKTERKEA